MGIFHDPLPAGYFSAFSSYLDCCVWGGLSVSCQLVVPLYCGVGIGIGWVAFQDFLVREACVGVLVRGNGFLLSGVQWSAQ